MIAKTIFKNENLFNHVKETVLKYRFQINLKEFNKNIVDPIKLSIVFEELSAISSNILQSLYLLSFSRYEGFNSFEMTTR